MALDQRARPRARPAQRREPTDRPPTTQVRAIRSRPRPARPAPPADSRSSRSKDLREPQRCHDQRRPMGGIRCGSSGIRLWQCRPFASRQQPQRRRHGGDQPARIVLRRRSQDAVGRRRARRSCRPSSPRSRRTTQRTISMSWPMNRMREAEPGLQRLQLVRAPASARWRRVPRRSRRRSAGPASTAGPGRCRRAGAGRPRAGAG